MKPILTSLLLVLLFTACQAEQPATETSTTEPLAGQQTSGDVYTVRGQVVTSAVDGTAPEGQALVVDHEPIEGSMGSMRMTIQIGEGVDVSGLQSGDKIAFDLAQRGGEFVMERVEELPADTELELQGVEVNVPVQNDSL